jgi:hypothetical protein
MNKNFLNCNNKLAKLSAFILSEDKAKQVTIKAKNPNFYFNKKISNRFKLFFLENKKKLRQRKEGLSLIEVHSFLNTINQQKRYNYENNSKK